MFYRRLHNFAILPLLLLCTSAASFAATVIYVQTYNGRLYKSTDSAATWTSLNTAGNSSGLTVDPQNTDNLYSYSVSSGTKQTTGQQGINRSTDGGQTWTATLLPTPAGLPLAIDATMSNIIYLAGFSGASGGRSYRSTDYGATFQPATYPAFATAIKTYATQPGAVYLLSQASTTNPGGIFKSTDYGVTWSLVAASSTIFGNSSGGVTDLAVDPNNSSILYVAARSSACGTGTAFAGPPPCGLIKSIDAGKTWQAVFGDDIGNVVVDARNGNVYAGGYRQGTVTVPRPTGEVVKSTDGGKTFTSVTTGFNTLGVDVHLDPESPNLLYASQSRVVGLVNTGGPAVAGGVFVSKDSGATWTLGSVDKALSDPNDEIYSLFALTIKNPPPGVVNVLATGGRSDLFAPESIVSAFGNGLSTQTASATTNPPSTTLGGASVTLTDSAGASQPAELLYVSSAQVNYIIPAGLAAGAATVAFNSGSSTQNQTIRLGPVAPGLFTFNAAGLAAGSVLRVSGDGTQTAENLFQMDNSGNIVALPINLGAATDQVFLILYGTGFRAAGTANTTMTIGGQNAQVSFAGPQGAFAGLDQVNVLVPRSLAGRGSVSIVLTASGQTANTANISIQ